MLDIKTIFGKNIKALRLKLKLSQEKFAEKLESETKMISKIETGVSFTSSETIASICQAFDVTPDELFKINYNFLSKNEQTKEELIKNFLLQLKDLDIETIEFLLKINQSILMNYDRRRI